ncbi:MAG: energy-coupling factor transporter transmembrane component T [Tissierellia bacterium]|nr:energy-coupling factor transporter transmembrane component T [Tissierellia bacterium]
MLKDITIGQYIPGNSVIHRLDPRTKILFMITYIISIFLIKDFRIYIPLGIFLLWVIFSTKIPPKYVLKGLKPLVFIIVLTVGLNIFMTPGIVIARLGPLTITKEGLNLAGFMATRLIFLVMGTSLLTLTTSPKSLTDGLDFLLKPLTKIGFPSEQLTMMMTIALRFIPTLFEETDKIMKAQTARGADFESGNIFQRAKNLIPLLVPLFINAFRRADELATAMEARCYRVGEGRTQLKALRFGRIDYLALIFTFLFMASIIASRIL